MDPDVRHQIAKVKESVHQAEHDYRKAEHQYLEALYEVVALPPPSTLSRVTSPTPVTSFLNTLPFCFCVHFSLFLNFQAVANYEASLLNSRESLHKHLESLDALSLVRGSSSQVARKTLIHQITNLQNRMTVVREV